MEDNAGNIECSKCQGMGFLTKVDNDYIERPQEQGKQKLFDEIVELKKDKRDLESHLESLRNKPKWVEEDIRELEIIKNILIEFSETHVPINKPWLTRRNLLESRFEECAIKIKESIEEINKWKR